MESKGVGSSSSTRGGRRGEGREHGDLSGGNLVISCFYCKEPGHIKRFYPRLIRKNTQPQSSRFALKIGDIYNISMLKSDYAKYL